MAGLDARYIPLNYLQEYFVKVAGASGLGLPLAGGIVSFFQDQARTTPKLVYELNGTYPSYTYNPIGSVLTLGANGTFVDGDGNDITVYAFPYDEATGKNIELYYITVESSEFEAQFTREAVPNLIEEISPEQVEFKNFITNGQFLIHETQPQSGLITQNTTSLSQGGWYYYRTPGSVAVDNITFPAFGSVITTPSTNPKYSLNIINTNSGSSESYKYIAFTFNDVNKFASTTQYYTLTFSAISTGTTTPIVVYLNKYFGDGSPTAETYTPVPGGSITVGTSWQTFNIPFVFGVNTGSDITVNDSVSIGFGLPLTTTFNLSFTDVSLVIGNTTISQFPIQPNYEFQYQSLTPNVPDYFGNDLYLPVILTPTGLSYDHSIVGKIEYTSYPTPPANAAELICDGTTYYNADYSSLGIPYQRLGTVLYDTTNHIPRYGTGATFVTAFPVTTAATLNVSQNTTGTLSNPMADGATPTGFTFTKIVTGTTTAGFYAGISGFYQGSTSQTVTAITILPGICVAPTAGNTGWTLPVVYRLGTSNGTGLSESQIITFIVSSVPAASTYIIFSNTTTTGYLWFKVNGSGTDPNPVGTTFGIECDILSTYSITDVAREVGQALNGFQVTQIGNIGAASTLSSSPFFHMYNTAGTHYVYYFSVSGGGTAPLVPGARIIPVNISTGDTAAQVTTELLDAINTTAWAAPDLRGDFIRVWNNISNDDPDAVNRMSWNNGPYGNNLGSLQFDNIGSHLHFYSLPTASISKAGTSSNVWAASYSNAGTTYTGIDETRPINFYVQAVIKY